MLDLTPYAGRWVALAHGRVLGVGYTGVEALRLARRNHPKLKLELTYVPEQGGGRLALDPLLQKLKEVLARQDVPVYLVGGAVRDAVLGRISHDLDFVVPSEAIKLAFRVGDALGVPAFALDKERDVGRVVLPAEDTYLDFSSYRNGSLEADLAARDYTMNALAIPALAETERSIIDLFDGLRDLKQKQVRQVSAENLLADPVRGLRGVRMSVKYGFALTPETEATVRETFSLLDRVSAERVRDELNNMLGANSLGAILELQRLGGLAVVLPEVADLVGVVQSPPHYLDVWAHTAEVLRWLERVDTAVVQQEPLPAEEAHPLLQAAQVALADYAPALQAHFLRPITGELHGRVLWRWAAFFVARYWQTGNAHRG
ncbi:MAG: CCA tRNA nucleotidyltransferase [Anaerolineales bacterium]|nr:CCA tRNA nucleotidyltransferase [Anaerolineales bacterium]